VPLVAAPLLRDETGENTKYDKALFDLLVLVAGLPHTTGNVVGQAALVAT
jgi:hypothetical protein